MLVGNVFLFVECNIISGRHFGPDIFSAVSLATTVSPLVVCMCLDVHTSVGFVVISLRSLWKTVDSIGKSALVVSCFCSLQTIHFTAISIGLGMGTACDTLFSQAYGSPKPHRIGMILQRSAFPQSVSLSCT